MSKNGQDKPDLLQELQAKGFNIEDPQQLAMNLARFFDEGSKVMVKLVDRMRDPAATTEPIAEWGDAMNLFGQVAGAWMNNPMRVMEAQGKLMAGYANLWSNSMLRMMGNTVDPVAEPGAGDRRFNDPEWSDNHFFDFWKQAYLLSAQWVEEIVDDADGLDGHAKKRAEFYLRQLISAMSPTNFAFTNPEVMREILTSNGENLVKGMEHLSKDLEKPGEVFRVSQTDMSAFKVGKNLAVTPGKVVFQNELIQLIQYTPTTKEVYRKPLLIVPPWINKYYILDLVPEKSFMSWAVSQGFTVFTISWVNPDESLADKTFEDYMIEGIYAAIDNVLRATGESKLNALGYCVGGTLLATALAHMAKQGDNRIASATFLTTQVDFSRAGDLLIFVDDKQLRALDQVMDSKGYLDSSRMANVFNMLRPMDLIWPYVVNNYMLGKKPFPFDMLFWNSDSTRMTPANHSFYMREFYLENKLAKGELVIDGERMDLSEITVPIYELATREDHIAPAESVFIGAKMFGGPVKYVLSGSGHIAGVVNPPEKKKYQYWTNAEDADNYADWLASAKEHPGSWWPDWASWLRRRSGKKIPARTPGKGKLKPIENAPGSYVVAA